MALNPLAIAISEQSKKCEEATGITHPKLPNSLFYSVRKTSQDLGYEVSYGFLSTQALGRLAIVALLVVATMGTVGFFKNEIDFVTIGLGGGEGIFLLLSRIWTKDKMSVHKKDIFIEIFSMALFVVIGFLKTAGLLSCTETSASILAVFLGRCFFGSYDIFPQRTISLLRQHMDVQKEENRKRKDPQSMMPRHLEDGPKHLDPKIFQVLDANW